MNYLIAGIIGLFGGVASGLFGVGGGVVMVPAMVFFLALDFKVAVGTSLAVIIPTALVGSFQHYQQGNLAWRTALMLAPTAMLGGFSGAWLTKHIDSSDLKKMFGGFLVLVGLKLIFFK